MGGGAGQPQSNSNSEPQPQPESEETRKANDRETPNGAEARKTLEEEAAKRDREKQAEANRGAAKPKDGEAGDPSRPPVNAWHAELPAELRRIIVSGDTSSVPPQYRHLIEVYQKWLLDHTAPAAGR